MVLPPKRASTDYRWGLPGKQNKAAVAAGFAAQSLPGHPLPDA
jgi:hypothetical protein